jgi:excisionase family DNA binding protein
MVSASQLLTVRQVAARLCLSASAVYQLIESRQLAHHRLGSHKGAIRVSEADLTAYLATCREEQAQQKQQERRPKRTTLKHLRLY